MTATPEKESIRALLLEAHPKHTAKAVARATGASLATCKAWVSGRYQMPAALLLKAATACELIAMAMLRRLDARRAAAPVRDAAAGLRPAAAPTRR